MGFMEFMEFMGLLGLLGLLGLSGFFGFNFGNLIDTALMAAAFEFGCQEDGHDLLSEAEPDDSGTDTEHVGVVMCPGHARGVQVVAQCRTYPMDLVGGQLFTLAAATHHDPEVGLTVADDAANGGTELRVITACRAVGAHIRDVMTLTGEQLCEVRLQLVSGVIGTQSNTCHLTSVRGGFALAPIRTRAVV